MIEDKFVDLYARDKGRYLSAQDGLRISRPVMDVSLSNTLDPSAMRAPPVTPARYPGVGERYPGARGRRPPAGMPGTPRSRRMGGENACRYSG